MKDIGMSLAAAVGLALVITAATMRGRQTPAVINSMSWGAVRVMEASLGQRP